MTGFLLEWAKGHMSAACMWRICNGIVTRDGTDAGAGMHRLASIATDGSETSEKNCHKKADRLTWKHIIAKAH